MNKTISLIIILSIFPVTVHPQWIPLNSGTTQNLNCVYFINQQTGFIAGTGSALRKTTDGGLNWVALDPFGALELRSIFFFNASTGFVCGYSGTIIKTTNGGLNWNIISSGTSNHLLSLSFYNNLTGICCGNGGTTLYTTNGGDNWSIGNPQGYLVTFYSAFMLNSTAGFCAGVNTIFSPLVAKTSNGGANWTYYSFMVNNNEATLYGIHFFNNQNGIAVSTLWNGQGGISRTSNGGVNWTSQILTAGLFSLDFPVPTVGYCVGLNGAILKSTDGGYNWSPQTSGTSASLRSVYFVDSLYGYAAGNTGIVLKTTNGGITGISRNSNDVPQNFRLYQNYPNPFNPITKLRFDIPFTKGGKAGFVTLKIYNILGSEVITLINEQLKPGTYEVDWNTSNCPSGVYFYKLISGEFTDTKKMILIR